MKNIDLILKDKRIINIFRNIQNNKCIQIKVNVKSNYNNKIALVKFTKAVEWEHLCVSFIDEIPSWNFMQEMKEMFWNDDEVCIQIHPSKENYINNNEYCLHIWKPIDKKIPLPPTILIGFRNGKEEEDKIALKKIQEEMGNPLTDKQIELYTCNDKSKIDKILSNLTFDDLLKMIKE